MGARLTSMLGYRPADSFYLTCMNELGNPRALHKEIDFDRAWPFVGLTIESFFETWISMWRNTYLGPSTQYLKRLGQVIQAIEGSVFASEPDSTWKFCLLSTRSSRKNHLYLLFHIYIHAATNLCSHRLSFVRVVKLLYLLFHIYIHAARESKRSIIIPL